MADVNFKAIEAFIKRTEQLMRNVAIAQAELSLIDEHLARGRIMVPIECPLSGTSPTRSSRRITTSINLGLIRAQVENQLKRDEAALRAMLPRDVP